MASEPSTNRGDIEDRIGATVERLVKRVLE